MQCFCIWNAGYTGTNCETDIDECADDPCENGGTCHDLIGVYNCTCAPGYVGDVCHSEDPCYNDTVCANGGECQRQVDDTARNATMTCQCNDPWLPPYCREQVRCVVFFVTGYALSVCLVAQRKRLDSSNLQCSCVYIVHLACMIVSVDRASTSTCILSLSHVQ